jgi:hypothetical protein
MAARIQTLAAALVTQLQAYPSLPAGITVSRRRSYTAIIDEVSDTQGFLTVICPRVEDTSNRGDVSEDITIAIVLTVRCTAEAVAASDTYEDLLEGLCDHLRTSATYRQVTLSGNIAARRRSVSIATTCDGEILDQMEVFVGVIETTWAVGVGNRS